MSVQGSKKKKIQRWTIELNKFIQAAFFIKELVYKWIGISTCSWADSLSCRLRPTKTIINQAWSTLGCRCTKIWLHRGSERMVEILGHLEKIVVLYFELLVFALPVCMVKQLSRVHPPKVGRSPCRGLLEPTLAEPASWRRVSVVQSNAEIESCDEHLGRRWRLVGIVVDTRVASFKKGILLTDLKLGWASRFSSWAVGGKESHNVEYSPITLP